MNRYVKLVRMELARFWKLYAALFVVTLLSQTAGLYLFLQSYMNRVHEQMYQYSYSYVDYAKEFGRLRFDTAVAQSDLWFIGPVFLCIITLLLYVFFIWYRDWLGKNPFSYRLLMLPTDRMNLFWSKLTAILMFVLGLVAFQLLLLPVHYTLFRHLIPAAIGSPEPMTVFIRHHSFLQVLIPPTFLEFVLYYGAGLVGVSVLFTAVLIERSFRLPGAIGGVLYIAAAVLLMAAPLWTQVTGGGLVLYPAEAFMLEIGLGLLLLAVSLGLSRYLLHRKITV